MASRRTPRCCWPKRTIWTSRRKRLIVNDGEIEYDTLIAATGSQNFYFGHDDWQEVAPGLKTIEEATQIRHKILFAFEAAEREADPVARRAWLTFVVVGAGPTGVELAGALGEIANDTLKNEFRSIRPEEAQILLVDGSPRVLPPYPEELSAAAEQHLIHLGVRARNNVRVTGIDEDGVTLHGPNGDERIRCQDRDLGRRRHRDAVRQGSLPNAPAPNSIARVA